MDTKEAILTLAQAEKAKSGLLMTAQLIEMYNGLSDNEKHSADRFLRALIGMVANEIHLSRKLSAPDTWSAVDKNLNSALVMMNSGVLSEANYHIVQAISSVTTICQRSMQFLIDRQLL